MGDLRGVVVSIDEARTRLPNLPTLLAEHLAEWPAQRPVLRFACRTAEWPAKLHEALVRCFGRDLTVVELLPLRRQDVAALVAELVDPESSSPRSRHAVSSRSPPGVRRRRCSPESSRTPAACAIALPTSIAARCCRCPTRSTPDRREAAPRTALPVRAARRRTPRRGPCRRHDPASRSSDVGCDARSSGRRLR